VEESEQGRLGIARLFALIFGAGYIILASTEILLQHRIADETGIQFSPTHNAIHLVLGVVILVAGFGSERTAGAVDIFVGVVFIAICVSGLVWGHQFGDLMGLHGNMPPVYNVGSAVSGVLALIAGFAGRRKAASA
jgi:hypothetical protein